MFVASAARTAAALSLCAITLYSVPPTSATLNFNAQLGAVPTPDSYTAGPILKADHRQLNNAVGMPPVHTNTAPVYRNTAPVYTDTAPVYRNTAPVYTDIAPVYTDTAPVQTSLYQSASSAAEQLRHSALHPEWLPTKSNSNAVPGWALDDDIKHRPKRNVPLHVTPVQTQQRSAVSPVGTTTQQNGVYGVPPVHTTVAPVHTPVPPVHTTVAPVHTPVPPVHTTVAPVHTSLEVAQSPVATATPLQIPPAPNMTAQTLSKDTARLSLSGTGTGSIMTIEEIKAALPHRYPFLFVDRVLHLEKGRRGIGVKQVSANEEFFQGHFPERSVMPGVLQVEALAQLAGIVFSDSKRLFLFTGVDSVKWRRTVVPGDTLLLEVNVTQPVDRRGFVRCTGKGYVGGRVAVEVNQMSFKSAPQSATSAHI